MKFTDTKKRISFMQFNFPQAHEIWGLCVSNKILTKTNLYSTCELF